MANDSDRERIQRSDSSMSRQSVSLSTLTISSAAVNLSKPAIVLSIGSRITRCGIAGEFEPRYSMLTKEIISEATDENLSDGEGATELLMKIFYEILTVDSRGARVLIVESPFCQTKIRNALCRTLIEKLDVGQVSFAPSPLMATLPFNVLTAFVLEIGHAEALAMPINEGVSMISQCSVNQRTGRAVIERGAQLLKANAQIEETNNQGRAFSDEEWNLYGEKLAEKFVEEYAFCTTRARATEIRQKGVEAALEPPTAASRIRLGPLIVTVPGFVRETVFEVLFDDDDENFTDPSIPKMVYETILRCPIDMRRKFFESLLVCGGLARTTGFLSRFKEELIAISTKNSTICGMEPKFFYFSEARAEHVLSWIGGSLLASCPYSLQIRSISRDDWNKVKRVPDWTDYISSRDEATAA